MVLAFSVPGVPVPKGSARAYAYRVPGGLRAAVTHDNPGTRAYGEGVARAALAARSTLQGFARFDGPVRVDVAFYVPRPRSLPRAVRYPIRRGSGDADKLLRAILDGLTAGGVYGDDAQVVETSARKAFAGGEADPAGPEGLPRAEVRVMPLPGAYHPAPSPSEAPDPA